jgi:hypothetical protein
MAEYEKKGCLQPTTSYPALPMTSGEIVKKKGGLGN